MDRAVIFDLDGTILDTINDIRSALNTTLGTDFSSSECSMFVGNGLRNAIRNALAASGRLEENVDKLFKTLVDTYMANPFRYTVPYSGVHGFLKALNEKNIAVVVFSNKEQDLAERIIWHCFPDIRFFMVIGRNGAFKAKPDPEAVFAVARKLCVTKESLFYIGDSEVDAECARRAGVRYAILTCGFRSREFLLENGVNPDMLVRDMDEAAERFFKQR